MEPWQIVASAFGVICGLVGVIYYAGQSRDDKQDSRAERNEHTLTEHDRAIAELKTDMATVKAEVRSLREMRHEIIEHCTRSISDFYTDSIKRLSELREWFVERMK